ncbi:hypothetical protein [Nocardioides jishulii]|uniref:Uncharacterized protein n=1 Tax=Nocardioides jishulii TaxID=2575440 RepID=A0A4U2YVJ2_9ACTN|nr:hypothetical protein [Nocardioides jishulii]QCX28345.1 hypothetical protein FCL41_13060 [Nocardioides jishulii]TKI64762.1 hypothetical protein FC770_06515 [Nocardioides jishulii]
MKSPTLVVPDPGQAVVIRFDGRDVVLWWGKGEGDREVLAAHDGRLMTWESVEAAVAHAEEAGWEIDWDAGITSDQSTLMDFSGAQRRLESERAPVAPESAMFLWNFATDVSHTLDIPFHDKGRLADECYEKLTKATIPSVYGLDTYKLQWTPAEFKAVRRIMADAVHVVRVGLGVS